jgi:hypothetical protein
MDSFHRDLVQLENMLQLQTQRTRLEGMWEGIWRIAGGNNDGYCLRAEGGTLESVWALEEGLIQTRFPVPQSPANTKLKREERQGNIKLIGFSVSEGFGR